MVLWKTEMTIRRALIRADVPQVARHLNLPVATLEAFAIGNGQLAPEVLNRLAEYLVEVLDPLRSPALA